MKKQDQGRSTRKPGLSAGQVRYLSRSRQRRHDEAEAETPIRSAIPDHPLICKAEPELITEAKELEDFIDHVRAAGSFAYDTEFIGELTYYPHLCVVQAATTERIAVIDPLAELDLSEFWNLIADETVETIVHAGTQDLEPIGRLTGRPPRNIFDTQIAIGFVNLPHPLSLREAVRIFLNAKLSKGSTFTQWDRRPLTEAQLHYAANDVRFLPAIRAKLGTMLEEFGHTDWAGQEFALLTRPETYAFDPLASCKRIRGAKRMGKKQLATLISLVQWREATARDANIPARSLLKDDALRVLASKPITSRAALRKAGVLPRNIDDDCGDDILAAITASADRTDTPSLRQPEESGTQRYQIDSLWALTQAWCFGRAVHPSLVAGRGDIAEWVMTGHSARLSEAWRAELLGDLLDQLRQGQAAIHVDWRDDRLRAEATIEGE